MPMRRRAHRVPRQPPDRRPTPVPLLRRQGNERTPSQGRDPAIRRGRGGRVSLKVKDEETCRAASELAQRTGDTLAAAIALVLREHLERES